MPSHGHTDIVGKTNLVLTIGQFVQIEDIERPVSNSGQEALQQRSHFFSNVIRKQHNNYLVLYFV